MLRLQKYGQNQDNDHIFAAATILLHRTKDTFTTDVYYTLLMAFAKEGRDRDIIPLIDAFELREVYKRIHNYRVEANKDPSVWHRNSTQYSLEQKLLMIEDFDNIDWSDTELSKNNLDDTIAEILGHDKVIEILWKSFVTGFLAEQCKYFAPYCRCLFLLFHGLRC